jgi:hypothetical protein
MHAKIRFLGTFAPEKLVRVTFEQPLVTLNLDYDDCRALGAELLRHAEDIKPPSHSSFTPSGERTADYDHLAQG